MTKPQSLASQITQQQGAMLLLLNSLVSDKIISQERYDMILKQMGIR